jgi:predicted amidohydrolase
MKTRVAVVQTNPRLGRPAENAARALRLLEKTPADVYVLPELAFSGYNFSARAQALALAEPAGRGAAFEAVADFCRRRKAHAAYGFPERAGRRMFNAAALVGPRGLAGVYRKVHLFGREKLFFSPGDRGFSVWKLPFGRVGLMVCFDWYFPEAVRTLALQGAELVLHPSNLILPHCPEAMRTRCLDSRVYAATADRVGTEPGGDRPLTFIGSSQVVSPRGEVLVRLGRKAEGVGAVSVELSGARDKRLNRYNDLFKDRRPAAYRL